MILTCPSCGTQYAVKDGAIPPQGRQVRCASCKHAWHQDPEGGDLAGETAGDSGQDETIAEAALIEPRSGPEAEERAFVEAAIASENGGDGVANEASAPGDERAEAPAAVPAGLTPGIAPVSPVAPPADPYVEPVSPAPAPPEDRAPSEEARAEDDWRAPADESSDDGFSPFTMEEHDEREERGPLTKILLAALLIAALAAAFWFLAPIEWKERVGLASSGETPLQLMITHSDRQKLASGNELLAVSGRVINPTDEKLTVPPIRGQLRSSTGKLVYSWTIAPPARTLAPGDSRTFNSAEVDVPPGGDQLTVTLGSAKT